MIVSFGAQKAHAWVGRMRKASARSACAITRIALASWPAEALVTVAPGRIVQRFNACMLACDARFALQPRSQGVFHFCKMDIDWNDLRLFLDVARLGGLSAATGTTRLSAATLGRRVTALEKQIGEPLFVRQQTGYRLTPVGEELLRRAEDVEAAMQSLTRWREGNLPDRIVRVSAGPWTSAFVSAHIGEIWTVDDGIRVELVTTTDRVDIGRRAADIGIRSERPTEQWLAGRQSGKVAYAIYSGRRLINGIAAGLFVGVTGEAANIASARWLQAHHGDRIAVRGNNTHSVRELVAAGAGLSIFPCFVGDSDPRLVRVAQPIPELETDQWIVTHHEERHAPPIRKVADRIAALMRVHQPLFRGETPIQ
ncbi:MAG: LysR family transcriptional regulator [Mesorhizobium sp.]|nr:MAG: LysR family transcriptional regulator [Mesorhizobium sp.]RWN75944.1 MAG: LysR family transcriptional regulator [Mesorhizobium sp.]RWN79694.1 MAG: LysR family transcriptional regulator [Mesorhizobium sp.]RWN88361.1 MAG: LysR family transcriptional regulator [Mesorhizobium sp.]RWO14302.1 MAG: LysR family transcriptional regulator [Mesorhizobium sp.]